MIWFLSCDFSPDPDETEKRDGEAEDPAIPEFNGRKLVTGGEPAPYERN
jgi:hypothetical protein